MNSIHKAILRTLVYADIFNYPLTASEIHHWLIWQHSTKPPALKNITSIIKNTPHIQATSSYFYLKNHQKNISLRRQHHRFSQTKLKFVRQATTYLKLIPFINLIAVTGALAMNNSDKNDDIDLMIITQPNRLWLTRLLAIFLLEIFRLRRRPIPDTPGCNFRGNRTPGCNLIAPRGVKSFNNKICLNLFLDESSLKISLPRRNLFTAHEICQLKPLYNKNNTYQKFLNANSWTKKHLPNIAPRGAISEGIAPRGAIFWNFFELLAFKLQYAYMKSKITNEKINKHFAFFHPRPTAKILLQQYQAKLKQFNLK